MEFAGKPYTTHKTAASVARRAADVTGNPPPLIEYIEMEPYDENWTDGDSYQTRTLACKWGDRHQFQLDILGDATYAGSEGLKRIIPEKDPEFPDYFARSSKLIGGRGWPGPHPDPTKNGALFYFDSGMETDVTTQKTTRKADMQHQGLAVYAVRFEKPFYPILTDAELMAAYPLDSLRERFRYVYTTYEPGGSSYQAPKSLLKFEGDPDDKPVTELAPLYEPEMLVTKIWYMVPVEVLDLLITTNRLFGKFNDTQYTVDGTLAYQLKPGYIGSVNTVPNGQLLFDNRWPAETLLGLPPKVEPYQAGTGKLFHNISFPWAFRATGWNRFIRDDATFRRVVRKATPTEGAYLKYDFGQLWNMAPG